jgi:hypothetical protein
MTGAIFCCSQRTYDMLASKQTWSYSQAQPFFSPLIDGRIHHLAETVGFPFHFLQLKHVIHSHNSDARDIFFHRIKTNIPYTESLGEKETSLLGARLEGTLKEVLKPYRVCHRIASTGG